MTKNKTSLINYENPPVTEVVCGILFKPIKTMLVPHFGLLWEKYKPEYSNCSEVPPLNPIIEPFEEEDPEIGVEISDIPLLPRIWFIHENENGIIQVQRDRFLVNWRKVRTEDEYPRYCYVIDLFRENLSRFESFLGEYDLGKIISLQYEMTYINHIPQKKGWETLNEIGNLFPDFSYRNQIRRFLPDPNVINWRTSFLLPDRNGRLHVNIRKAVARKTNTPLILLELTVRGIGSDKKIEGMWKWFDLAHEWIVYGFADLTSEEVQKRVWKKEN